MKERELEEALRSLRCKLKGKQGCWETELDGVQILIICDEKADRVRVIGPIHAVGPDDGEYLHQLLSANFDRALDARYAIFKDHLWATFLHDLSSLTRESSCRASTRS
jgi:hypothetical protein